MCLCVCVCVCVIWAYLTLFQYSSRLVSYDSLISRVLASKSPSGGVLNTWLWLFICSLSLIFPFLMQSGNFDFVLLCRKTKLPQTWMSIMNSLKKKFGQHWHIECLHLTTSRYVWVIMVLQHCACFYTQKRCLSDKSNKIQETNHRQFIELPLWYFICLTHKLNLQHDMINDCLRQVLLWVCVCVYVYIYIYIYIWKSVCIHS